MADVVWLSAFWKRFVGNLGALLGTIFVCLVRRTGT